MIGETIALDPGPAIDSHIDAIHNAMPKLDTILITHRHADHAPAAAPLKRATGARIIAPRGVLDETDRIVSDGDVIGDIEVVATPGHTSEHVCYLTADGDLFTGDTILGFGTTAIFPPDGNMADYIASLRKLRARKPRRILVLGPTPLFSRPAPLPCLPVRASPGKNRRSAVLRELADEMPSGPGPPARGGGGCDDR